MRRKVDNIEGLYSGMAERIATIESYVTYSLGVITQHKINIHRQGKSVLDLVRRAEALEDAA